MQENIRMARIRVVFFIFLGVKGLEGICKVQVSGFKFQVSGFKLTANYDSSEKLSIYSLKFSMMKFWRCGVFLPM